MEDTWCPALRLCLTVLRMVSFCFFFLISEYQKFHTFSFKGRGLQFSGLSLSALPSMNSTTTSTNGNYHHDSRKISSTAGYGPPLTPPGSLSTPPLNPSSAATVATSATPASLTPPYYEHQHIKYSPN